MKTISVIIPYFNASSTLLKALDSINNQTYLPKEVVIVDDYSDVNNSLQFLESRQNSYSFELKLRYHKKNLGASSARNYGIKEACSEYIAFLDADDCWVEKKLENQILAIGSYDYLYSNYVEGRDQISNGNHGSYEQKKISYFDVLKKNLSPVTLLVRKESIVLFDERFRRCDDFKMSIEALAKGRQICYLNFDAAYGFKKAIGGGGLTRSLLKMSFAYLKACVYLIREYPRLIMVILPFILFEIIKFPIRCLKVYVLN